MGNNILKGKKGIIFGALDEKSIAWKVAEKAYDEGAQFVLTNVATAERFGKVKELAQKTNSEFIAADATKPEELEELFKKSMDILGGKIDFVLHSIGMSMNIRKGLQYHELNYNYYMKTLDVSAISFHKVMQTAFKLDAMNKGGSIVALTYIAAQRTFYGYNDMADAKALLESIARSFGYIFGKEKKVRVNTVSQSPVRTTAGQGIKQFGSLFDYAEKMSPLGNADGEDAANLVVMLFSDYTKRITMQNIYNDGGFSSMGVSEDFID